MKITFPFVKAVILCDMCCQASVKCLLFLRDLKIVVRVFWKLTHFEHGVSGAAILTFTCEYLTHKNNKDYTEPLHNFFSFFLGFLGIFLVQQTITIGKGLLLWLLALMTGDGWKMKGDKPHGTNYIWYVTWHMICDTKQ